MRVGGARSLGSVAVPLLARLLVLPALWYYGGRLKKVDEKMEKVAELRVEEVASVIWSSVA